MQGKARSNQVVLLDVHVRRQQDMSKFVGVEYDPIEKVLVPVWQLPELLLCDDPECLVSTGIHEGTTFGKGKLDFNGFWEFPCAICRDLRAE